MAGGGGERRLCWGLGARFRLGERFSLPDEASLDGDLAGFLSLSLSRSLSLSLSLSRSLSLSVSDRLGLRSLDRDRRSLDRLRFSGDLDLRPPRLRLSLDCVVAAAVAGGDGLLLARAAGSASSAGDGVRRVFSTEERLLLAGDLDFLARSLLRSGVRERFLSLDLLRAFVLSLAAGSAPLLLFLLSDFCGFPARSLDLLRLRRLDAGLLPSVDSRRGLASLLAVAPPCWPLGVRVFPAADRGCSPLRARSWISPSSSEPEL